MNYWVRFWMQGSRGGKEEEYKLYTLDPKDPKNEEFFKGELDYWLENTPVWKCTDHARYGFESVKKLPADNKLSLIRYYEAQKIYADKMLKMLEEQ